MGIQVDEFQKVAWVTRSVGVRTTDLKKKITTTHGSGNKRLVHETDIIGKATLREFAVSVHRLVNTVDCVVDRSRGCVFGFF